MRSKKVRAAMIAAAACLSFTSVVAPSATALAAGYTGLAQEANGNWYYYNNGQKVTSGTNLVQNEYGWWYVKNGQIDFYLYRTCPERVWLVVCEKRKN